MGQPSNTGFCRLAPKLWVIALAIWTGLLITPGNWFPGGATSQSVGGIGVGKILHVAAYAVLAGSVGWLPFSRRVRLCLSLGLILHGGMTELIQTQVPYREGCWSDVGIDTVGVLTGWLTTFRWWPA